MVSKNCFNCFTQQANLNNWKINMELTAEIWTVYIRVCGRTIANHFDFEINDDSAISELGHDIMLLSLFRLQMVAPLHPSTLDSWNFFHFWNRRNLKKIKRSQTNKESARNDIIFESMRMSIQLRRTSWLSLKELFVSENMSEIAFSFSCVQLFFSVVANTDYRTLHLTNIIFYFFNIISFQYHVHCRIKWKTSLQVVFALSR